MSAETVAALTFIQPWGTLVEIGVKLVETRNYEPRRAGLLGSRIAIHAGRKLENEPGGQIDNLLTVRFGPNWRSELPRGQVIATATITGWAQVRELDPLLGLAHHYPDTEVGSARGQGSTLADPWGDFGEGRWLWFLSDVESVIPPVDAVGRQGFWNWKR